MPGDYTITHYTDCNPVNGGIAIQNIRENGIQVAYNPTAVMGGPNYTFTWSDQSGNPVLQGGVPVTGNTITGQVDGTYTVVATNSITKCSTFTQITINNTKKNPSLVLKQESFDSSCDPAIGAGSGRLSVSVTEGSVTGITAGYKFEWFKGYSTNPADALPAANISGANGEIARQLPVGKYTVVVTDITTPGTGCSSSGTFEVIFKTSKPEITKITKVDQNDCYNSGSIIVTEVMEGGVAAPLTDYYFNWYDANFSVIPNNNNTKKMEFLPAGTYFVEAVNINSTCRTQLEVKILDKSKYPVLEFQILSLQKSCYANAPNGGLSITANGIADINRFTYTWYKDSIPLLQTNKLFDNSTEILHRNAGLYTVSVQDNVTGCKTVGSYLIENYLVEPLIFAEIEPVTNCAEDKYNGAITATVKGDTTGYTFKWYKGNKVQGAAIGLNSIIKGLAPHDYTVLVTNIETGCTTDSTFLVPNESIALLKPNVAILSQVTSCIRANGALEASMTQNNNKYIFTWYEGNQPTGPGFISNKFTDLGAGEYTVVAMDTTTGCSSEPATVIIENQKVPLEFEVETTDAECNHNNGSAKVILPKDVEVKDVLWNSGSWQIPGIEITGVPAGEYEVTVIDMEGCSNTKTATIKYDVYVKNAITSNDDGINDLFKIGCIESFPNNHVKIFNRAGALVYKSSGYDNKSIFFDGSGNHGAYIMNSKLPVGTYFYIIDKGDGSKPRSGYLELIR